MLAKRVLVESRAPGRRRMPDLLGGADAGARDRLARARASSRARNGAGTSARVLGSFAAAFAAGRALRRFARAATARPLIDLSLLRIRAFALSNGVTIVMAAGFYAYTLCNVLFLTGVWRYSVLRAGLALTPGPFTAMAVAGPRRAVLVGASVTAWWSSPARSCGPAGWSSSPPRPGVQAGLPRRVAAGAADPRRRRGADVPDAERRGRRLGAGRRASRSPPSLNSVARQLGAALGVAVLIAILGTPSATRPAASRSAHGWLFAGGCFLAGAIFCLGARRRPSHGSPQPTAQAPAATDRAPAAAELAGPLAADARRVGGRARERRAADRG